LVLSGTRKKKIPEDIVLLRTTLTVFLFSVVSVAAAQERIADYNNSVRVEYQFIHTGDLDTSFGPLDVGETDTHVLLLSGVFSLGDRWKVYGSIPYVQKRHTGASPHDFTEFSDYTPPDLRLIDDGDYHGGFQDFHGGIQYLALEGPFSVSPYLSYGYPLTNYPFYGSAAIGRNAWEVPVGVSLGFTPYFSDWYLQGDIAYAFSEKTLGVNLNYWLMYASFGYYVTPRFVPRIFLSSRQAPNGLKFPDDFTDDFSDDDFDNEWWYYHDRTIRHNYLNLGIGFDYVVSERYELSATFYRTIKPDNIVEVDYAFTFGLMYNF